ncbi:MULTISPECIES: RNA polymerase sigma factor [Sphingobium]|jgi:RNA polymerase sigma factor (sigma-70 family)|uniref:RNA polymerase sigma factor n=1 Tax=Sphingobium TaxID=165695 RepID=UPI0010F9CE17|nr:RNA polymerase sigma factor [Sphingobium sp. RSMS]UXC92972.1 RNA polymerase sigma factor [Sphingobium sp. RSMS]
MSISPQRRVSPDDDDADSAAPTIQGFANLYLREKPRLLRYFLQKLGNRADADEMTQEVMTRFLGATPAVAVATPRAYITRIATNMLRDRAERGSTRLSQLSVPLDEGLHKSNGMDPHREVEARQEVQRWRAILQQLPPRTLDIFLLNRVEGYSYREIATDLRLPLWMVQKHMLKAIRHIAANHGDGHE